MHAGTLHTPFAQLPLQQSHAVVHALPSFMQTPPSHFGPASLDAPSVAPPLSCAAASAPPSARAESSAPPESVVVPASERLGSSTVASGLPASAPVWPPLLVLLPQAMAAAPRARSTRAAARQR